MMNARNIRGGNPKRSRSGKPVTRTPLGIPIYQPTRLDLVCKYTVGSAIAAGAAFVAVNLSATSASADGFSDFFGGGGGLIYSSTPSFIDFSSPSATFSTPISVPVSTPSVSAPAPVFTPDPAPVAALFTPTQDPNPFSPTPAVTADATQTPSPTVFTPSQDPTVFAPTPVVTSDPAPAATPDPAPTVTPAADPAPTLFTPSQDPNIFTGAQGATDFAPQSAVTDATTTFGLGADSGGVLSQNQGDLVPSGGTVTSTSGETFVASTDLAGIDFSAPPTQQVLGADSPQSGTPTTSSENSGASLGDSSGSLTQAIASSEVPPTNGAASLGTVGYTTDLSSEVLGTPAGEASPQTVIAPFGTDVLNTSQSLQFTDQSIIPPGAVTALERPTVPSMTSAGDVYLGAAATGTGKSAFTVGANVTVPELGLVVNPSVTESGGKVVEALAATGTIGDTSVTANTAGNLGVGQSFRDANGNIVANLGVTRNGSNEVGLSGTVVDPLGFGKDTSLTVTDKLSTGAIGVTATKGPFSIGVNSQAAEFNYVPGSGLGGGVSTGEGGTVKVTYQIPLGANAGAATESTVSDTNSMIDSSGFIAPRGSIADVFATGSSTDVFTTDPTVPSSGDFLVPTDPFSFTGATVVSGNVPDGTPATGNLGNDVVIPRLDSVGTITDVPPVTDSSGLILPWGSTVQDAAGSLGPAGSALLANGADTTSAAETLPADPFAFDSSTIGNLGNDVVIPRLGDGGAVTQTNLPPNAIAFTGKLADLGVRSFGSPGADGLAGSDVVGSDQTVIAQTRTPDDGSRPPIYVPRSDGTSDGSFSPSSGDSIDIYVPPPKSSVIPSAPVTANPQPSSDPPATATVVPDAAIPVAPVDSSTDNSAGFDWGPVTFAGVGIPFGAYGKVVAGQSAGLPIGTAIGDAAFRSPIAFTSDVAIRTALKNPLSVTDNEDVNRLFTAGVGSAVGVGIDLGVKAKVNPFLSDLAGRSVNAASGLAPTTLGALPIVETGLQVGANEIEKALGACTPGSADLLTYACNSAISTGITTATWSAGIAEDLKRQEIKRVTQENIDCGCSENGALTPEQETQIQANYLKVLRNVGLAVGTQSGVTAVIGRPDGSQAGVPADNCPTADGSYSNCFTSTTSSAPTVPPATGSGSTGAPPTIPPSAGGGAVRVDGVDRATAGIGTVPACASTCRADYETDQVPVTTTPAVPSKDEPTPAAPSDGTTYSYTSTVAKPFVVTPETGSSALRATGSSATPALSSTANISYSTMKASGEKVNTNTSSPWSQTSSPNSQTLSSASTPPELQWLKVKAPTAPFVIDTSSPAAQFLPTGSQTSAPSSTKPTAAVTPTKVAPVENPNPDPGTAPEDPIMKATFDGIEYVLKNGLWVVVKTGEILTYPVREMINQP